MLQHAWAQFEHDIRYKGTIPEALAPDLDRRFTLAAGLLELADREFEVIRDRLRAELAGEAPEADASDPRIADQELAAFLAAQFPEAGWSRSDHYTWMAGLLLELGITSLRELDGLLPAVSPPRSPNGWATSTRRAPSAGSTTPCWPSSASATWNSTATHIARTCSRSAWRSCTARP